MSRHDSRKYGFTYTTDEPDRREMAVVLRQIVEHSRHLHAVFNFNDGHKADTRRVRAINEHRNGIRSKVQAFGSR